MKTIAILNHKGGTGKTTSAINIGAGLAKKGKRVLLVDIDPQANLTEGLGIRDAETSIYDSIRDSKKLPVIQIHGRLDLVPSSIDLLGAELEIVSKIGREKIVTKLLKPLKAEYDYIILDCPPALGLLTINAVVAADTILLPLEAEYFAYKGIDRLIGIVEQVQEHFNENLTIGGVFVSKCNYQRTLTQTIINSITEYFGPKVFDAKIRVNVSLSEAQLQGQSVFEYAPDSNGAKDYDNLVNEILNKI